MTHTFDLDHDGRSEVLIAEWGNGFLGVLKGQDGGFGPEAGHSAPGVAGFDVGDLDGDGHPDVVIGGYNVHVVSVFAGLDGGAFGPATSFPNGTGFSGEVRIRDFDHDEQLDVVATAGTELHVWHGNGTLTLPPTYTNYPVGPLFGLAAGDLDGDGQLDLVVTSGAVGINVLRGLRDGGFDGPTPYGVGGSVYALTLGDFNNDGKLDVAVVSYPASQVIVLYNTGH